MLSVQKLVHHWKKGQFIPGGKPPQPLNDEIKEQRLSELNHNIIITQEITKGISILSDAVKALEKTQEFNRNPTSFIGDTRDLLMSDDYLLVADVLRLIFPEGMISKVWQLKRGRDEDLDTQYNDPAPGNRPILIPKSKKRRLDRLGEQEETRQEHKIGGLFGIPASQLRFTNGSEAQKENKTGGLFGIPASQLRLTNGSEAQKENKTGGLFGTPASQLRFTNGPETQEATGPLFGALSGPEATRYTGVFGAKEKGSNTSPAPQHTGIFSAKSPTPEYTGIFSQRIGFTSEKPTSPTVSGAKEKGSDTSPTPRYTGIFGAKSSEPQTGGIFSTKSPAPGYTGTFSFTPSGNKEEATINKALSSAGGDEVNKSLAQLQLLGQQEETITIPQGTKRKHEMEEETMNKVRNKVKVQEPYNLITL
jgi:hypothetical protein